jgi:hypothetical protein
MSEKLPLSGVNVLEQCGWNGVLTGRLLAEAGAHVIRAFPKNKDPLDSEPPFFGKALMTCAPASAKSLPVNTPFQPHCSSTFTPESGSFSLILYF